MAIKIVSPGRKSRKIYRTKCAICNCIFEFEEEDAKYIEDPRDGDAWNVTCPECGHLCWANTTVARMEK